jgi:hypothetical protein
MVKLFGGISNDSKPEVVLTVKTDNDLQLDDDDAVGENDGNTTNDIEKNDDNIDTYGINNGCYEHEEVFQQSQDTTEIAGYNDDDSSGADDESDDNVEERQNFQLV